MHLSTKFPTLIGLIILFIMVGGGILGFERVSNTIIKATPNIVPAHVTNSNVTDSSFTVTWTTNDLATGALTTTSSQQKTNTSFDERDIGGKLGKYLTHSVTVRSASANTDYSIKILSDGKQYLNQGKPWIVRTGPAMDSPPSAIEPAFGEVLTQTDQPAQGAIVFVTLEGAQTLSSLVSTSGSWIVALNTIRREDLTSYIEPVERLTETITVRAGETEAQAITDTLNDAPVPSIRLGKSYDFRKIQAKAPPSVLGSESKNTKPSNKVTLASPLQNSKIIASVPLITGTGVAGKQVAVTIGITKPIGGTTIVRPDGTWSYTPQTKLVSGKQSVTITTQDQANKSVAITHTFEVLKSGTQVLGEATPSATLTPTEEATLTGEPLPTSGSILPTILVIVIGLSFITGGAIYLTSNTKTI